MENVDAIVNAANEDLQHNGGLAKAIVDAGGPEIKSECDAYIEKNLKLKAGEAICCGPGRLSCKHVIHTVGPCWGGGGEEEQQILQSAVFSCLELAERTGLVSIAIPAISTGIFKVPVEVCAQASLQAVEEFARSYPSKSLIKIRFVLISQVNVNAFFSCFLKAKGTSP